MKERGREVQTMRIKTINTQTCKEQIQNLNVSEEVKMGLFKIEHVASSDNKVIKSLVKDIFICSPSCKELSKMAKCYERIITCNSVYPIRGTRTYLELAFPASGKDKEYKEFFASPKLAAATQDYFTGVFLISFEQWNSTNELFREPVFKDLIKFINDNKKHISFVFHVTPDFKDKLMLANELGKYVNLYLFEHDLPDMDKALEFVETKLNESGIKLDCEGKRELRKIMQEKINIESSCYKGYETLERIVSNLQFELYVQNSLEGERYLESVCIDNDRIRKAAGNISIPDETMYGKRQLGFK